LFEALSHYSSLARCFSPADLARAAARRAYRAAREALYEPAAVDAEALFAAFQLRAERPVWSDPSRRSDVLAALSRLPGAVPRALDRAQRAARREFCLFGSPISFADRDGIDWSLDPISGRRYPLLPWRRLRIDEPGMDAKYPWALGRLDQLIALGQGYWVSRSAQQRDRFAAEFSAQAIDFIVANPVGMGIHWTCPMEVALRASNLALALAMFRTSAQAADPRFLLAVLRSLVEHCEFVEAHLEDRAVVPNNHLIANFVGLLVVGLAFPELPTSARQVPLAARGLREQMQAQVHADGCSFEGSVPYHRLSLELFTLAQVVAQQSSVELGSAFEHRLRQMFWVAKAYCSEAGEAPQIGDNDSGRALALRDRRSLDHGYLAPLGAVLFGDPSLKRPGEALPDEAAWLFGERALDDFERMEGRAPPPYFSSPASGLHLLRGAGSLVAISAGPNGQNGVGGHSHNDKLSFELHLQGSPVIVDVGSPTYLRDLSQRHAFRSTRAHNTVEVDGRELSPLDSAHPFALPDEARARLERVESSAGCSILVASHWGYASLIPPVQIRRTFLLYPHRALLVSDQLLGGGSRSAVGRLHLPDSQARLRPATSKELARAQAVAESASRMRAESWKGPTSFSPTCVELGPPSAPRAAVLLPLGPTLEVQETLYSPSYGEVRPAAMLVYSLRGKLPLALDIVVLFG
jgi:hypothetical protein